MGVVGAGAFVGGIGGADVFMRETGGPLACRDQRLRALLSVFPYSEDLPDGALVSICVWSAEGRSCTKAHLRRDRSPCWPDAVRHQCPR